MVRLGLWGLNREGGWFFFWLTVAIAVGCVAYGFVDQRFFIGGLLLLAAWWYYYAIRWVDRHGGWK